MKYRRNIKRWLALLLTTALTAAVPAQTHAAEVTVTETSAVLYSNSKTVVYAKPDLNADIVTSIKAGLPVEVTGITSNGWFRIELEGVYYVPGYGLTDRSADGGSGTEGTYVIYSDEDIEEMTAGTFTFFTNSELRAYTKDEVSEMDANTYIKYLDSFLIGRAMVDYCILQDSGLTLKTEYDNAAEEDASVESLTMKDYLANYRNEYLEDSMWGPVRSESALKVVLNRAIRYDMDSFSTLYKSTAIGDSVTKMEKLLANMVETMEEEQGVTFTYSKEYDTYESPQGRSVTGWLVTFTIEEDEQS